MRKFVHLGINGLHDQGEKRELAGRVTDWLTAAIAAAPVQFQARKYGPVLAIPVFIQELLKQSSGYHARLLPAYSNQASRQSIMTEFLGYQVIPGYELAVVLFFPEGGGLSDRAVYRIEFPNSLTLPDNSSQNGRIEGKEI